MTKMSGAQALLESLERQNVDVIFGILGGAILPVYDALCGNKKIRHILARHEQGAAHAAEPSHRHSERIHGFLPSNRLNRTSPVQWRKYLLHDW
jgi:thiamine pyrophosphate-dependent acetolactate synthase large subunit-like protein